MKVLEALGAVVVVVLVGVALYIAVPAVLLWGANVNREVTQHSQSYTESKTQFLNGLMTDYASPTATAGQRDAIVNEFCYQVTLLMPSERPDNVLRFEAAHC